MVAGGTHIIHARVRILLLHTRETGVGLCRIPWRKSQSPVRHHNPLDRAARARVPVRLCQRDQIDSPEFLVVLLGTYVQFRSLSLPGCLDAGRLHSCVLFPDVPLPQVHLPPYQKTTVQDVVYLLGPFTVQCRFASGSRRDLLGLRTVQCRFASGSRRTARATTRASQRHDAADASGGVRAASLACALLV